MSDKLIDWDAIRVPLDFNKAKKARGEYSSYRELVAKSQEMMVKAQQAQELRKAQELELKPKLIDRLVNRTPITVMRSFQNPTETANGMVNDEEDDGFYTVVKSSNNGSGIRFQEVMETIPAGEVLQFKTLEKTLGQLIFKSKSGREYCIYKDPTVMFQGQTIDNPAYWGLIFNCDLNKEI
jgi:hypothetical protein